jgi:hypothetical protein
MSGYRILRRSSSDCVHFVYRDEVDGEDLSLAKELAAKQITHVYVDYDEFKCGSQHLVNVIAGLLKLEHAPYRWPTAPTEVSVWVEFLDDLITLSYQEHGIIIVIDNADGLLAADSKTMFKLIEAFLVQVHHWLEKKKPCHLCFQMEKNEVVKRLFAMP